MSFRFKTFIAGLSLFALIASITGPLLSAHPYEELTPDQTLYQRVKKLGDYGLLDPRDKAVLDQGKVVTRLELAFYTEKAKARISAPSLPLPQAAPAQPTATPPPVLMPDLMTLPPSLAATPTTVPAPALPPVSAGVRNEIDELLKELKQESALLKTRLNLNDQRIKEQEKELEALQSAQDEVNAVWKKANKSSGSPNFSSKARFRFENMHMSGVTVLSATRSANTMDVGMWSDLGGKGAISLGLTGGLSDSNANSGPTSLGIYNPDVTFALDGPAGHWDTHFMVEAYPGAGTLGDFTRGVAPSSLKRFVNPVDIKHFSDDKDIKTWDDYISNISLVPPTTAGGAIVSGFDRVFDGIMGIGTNLPLLGEDARVILMAGRYGGDTPQRWEEALKISKPLGPVQAEFSTEWVNDNFGVNQATQLDLKSYEGNFALNLKPVVIGLEVGLSSLYSGTNFGAPTNTALEGGAGQASIAFYPLTAYYTAISDSFANFSSKVAMSGVNFSQYGVYPASKQNASDFVDAYGLVGEVDNLVSNRYGWRVNLGWEGRKQDFMKNWPGILDDFIVNFDVSSKKEYRAATTTFSSGMDNPVTAFFWPNNPVQGGYNVIEAFNIIGPYYPDDEGIWGLDLWGGYAAAPWLPARQAYTSNIQALRNDGNGTGDTTRYQFILTSERIPLIMPVLDVNGNPVTNAPAPGVVAGQNTYLKLSHLKTYNYITLTTKWKISQTLGLSSPFYASFFFTDNSVSGQASDPTPPGVPANIPNLFDQSVYDVSGFLQVFRNVNLMADYGWEVWKSNYTWPLINYRTDAIGAGLAYDIPWGGSKFEIRYKHVTFNDQYVPANNYQTDQFISELFFLF